MIARITTADTYYNNFSKYLLLESSSKNTFNDLYSYSKWKSDPKSINTLSLKTLKTTLRHHKCRVYGNKPELIKRLAQYYLQNHYAITIQRIFRGFLVRESENARGPASKNRSMCVNATDFETMNPLEEMPREHFFSYRDPNGFVYGFNLFSLISIFTRTRHLVNPYNREEMPFAILQKLFSIYKKTLILYPLRCSNI